MTTATQAIPSPAADADISIEAKPATPGEEARKGLKPQASVKTHVVSVDYLEAAKEAETNLKKLGEFSKEREGSSPSLREVIEGKGSIFYSEKRKSENFTTQELNKIFSLPVGRKFTPELEEAVKAYQAKLVAEDPKWSELEAKLEKQGKTLIDGKVGPLTLAALAEGKGLAEGQRFARSDKGMFLAIPVEQK